MKSQRRHELQHNVLDAELVKTLDFFKKHGMRLLWGVLIVAVVVLAIRWYVVGRANARAEYAARYSALSGVVAYASGEQREAAISGLKALVEDQRVDRLAALACVDLGDAYAARMIEVSDPAERDSLAEQARKHYRQAIERFPTVPLAVGKARIGLAKLAESFGDFEEAAQQYRAAEDLVALSGQPVAILARAGRDKIEDLSQPVSLATTAPATRPAEAEATGESPEAVITVP